MHLNFEPRLFITFFVFSVFVSIIYYKTRNFWIVFLIHALSNLFTRLDVDYYIQELKLNMAITIVLFVISFVSCTYFIHKIHSRND
jgi:membrane protease YdiL (CAAX protease family)